MLSFCGWSSNFLTVLCCPFVDGPVISSLFCAVLSHRLPVDGPNGEVLVAEATVSGKKKDAVIACALEACRLLDMHGMLHASKRGTVSTIPMSSRAASELSFVE